MTRFRAYLGMACVCLATSSLCCAAANESTGHALMALKQSDINTYHSVMDLRMHAGELLGERVLADVCGPASRVRIERLDGWHGAPLWLAGRVAGGQIAIRNEADFFVIWMRRDAAVAGGGTPMDTILRATEGVLAEAYQPGPPSQVVAGESVAVGGEQIRVTSVATMPRASAYMGSYTNIAAERRSWPYVCAIHVLVKDRDVVIVCEKAKARQDDTPYVYEGLRAAKTRLNEKQAAEVAAQPVRAANVVFREGDDLTPLPSSLLNGCAWPIAGCAKTDVGSTQLMQEDEKSSGTASDLRKMKEAAAE
jgi:hypothetical protein